MCCRWELLAVHRPLGLHLRQPVLLDAQQAAWLAPGVDSCHTAFIVSAWTTAAAADLCRPRLAVITLGSSGLTLHHPGLLLHSCLQVCAVSACATVLLGSGGSSGVTCMQDATQLRLSGTAAAVQLDGGMLQLWCSGEVSIA